MTFMLARQGFTKQIPSAWLNVYNNYQKNLQAEMTLRDSEVPWYQCKNPGAEFDYIISLGGGNSDRVAPIAFDAQGNYDATSQEERLNYVARRLNRMPAALGLDEEQISNTQYCRRLINVQWGEKIMTLMNSIAYQMVMGDGTGTTWNGLADHVKAIMYWPGETTGTWTGKTIGGLSQDTYDVLKNYCYTTAITGSTTTPLPLLTLIKNGLFFAGRAGMGGRLGVCSLTAHTKIAMALVAANQQLLHVVYTQAKDKNLDILLGEHLYINGVPFTIEEYLDATTALSRYIYMINTNTLGPNHKGKSFIQYKGNKDLSDFGYAINSTGGIIETHSNLCNCYPQSSALISNFQS